MFGFMSEETIISGKSTAKLDGSAYISMVVSAANAIFNEKERINELNVFPVPDGDTGSNMSMTMAAAGSELVGMKGMLSECADKVAALCLRSARGNSGVILSLFFRGIAKGFKGLDSVGTEEISKSFQKGVEEAYKAVQNPTEGTILTVMRMSAESTRQSTALSDGELTVLFDRMVTAAEETLKKTPDLLPVLKQAHVVDAGGAGFLAILKGMRDAIYNRPVLSMKNSESATQSKADFSAFDTENIVNPYCTECIITKSAAYKGEGTADEFRKFVLSAGDSAVFVDDEEIIKVHVHTKNPGRVLSEALKYGTLFTVKVENMQNQHTSLVNQETVAPKKAPIEKHYGFVAVTPGEGIRSVFGDLGVDQFVSGGQTMNPSTEQLLKAIDLVPAEVIFVLPNNKNICLVAEQCVNLCEDKTVIVIPTVSVPQGISAMLAFQEEETPDENAANMNAAADQVTTLDLTFAARDSEFDGQLIRKGQLLGLVNHKVTYVADTQLACMDLLTKHMLDASYITVFYGSDVTEEEATCMVEHLKKNLGEEVEINALYGGQPLYYYIISVE
jgi:hypothetical protein